MSGLLLTSFITVAVLALVWLTTSDTSAATGVTIVILLLVDAGYGIRALLKAMLDSLSKMQRAEAKAKSEKAGSLKRELSDFIAHISESGSLPTVTTSNLHLQSGEFAILGESSAVLFELRRSRIGGGIGTRVKVGKMPLYLGGWKSTSVESPTRAASGDLYLTNQRLVFAGGTRTVTVTWKNLLAVEANLGGISVATTHARVPYVWKVHNPLLWGLLIQWTSRAALKTPTLPLGATLGITFEDGSAGLRVVLQNNAE